MFRKTLPVPLVLTLLFGLAALAPVESRSQALVDINSASLAEIEAVVRDENLARRIIESRPYANKRQLLSRQLMSMEQYEAIQERIVARRIETPEDPD